MLIKRISYYELSALANNRFKKYKQRLLFDKGGKTCKQMRVSMGCTGPGVWSSREGK